MQGDLTRLARILFDNNFILFKDKESLCLIDKELHETVGVFDDTYSLICHIERWICPKSIKLTECLNDYWEDHFFPNSRAAAQENASDLPIPW